LFCLFHTLHFAECFCTYLTTAEKPTDPAALYGSRGEVVNNFKTPTAQQHYTQWKKYQETNQPL